MSAPRIVCCWFERRAVSHWSRFARVLQHSAREHCRGWLIDVEKIDAPSSEDPFVCNTAKLNQWNAVVQAAADGDRVLLIDADTMILRSLDDVWGHAFDLAYTWRDSKRTRLPFNGGVVFLRVSPAVRAFMEAWFLENQRMLREPRYHRPWFVKFSGINQASFGKLLEEGALKDLAVERLPCSEWNAEQSTWHLFGPKTRIAHMKSGLERALFYPGSPRTEMMEPLLRRWEAYEREALAMVPA